VAKSECVLAIFNPVAKCVQRAVIVIVAAANICVPTHAADDLLQIYAVKVVKTTPFEKPFSGDGVYLGDGAVITAAHVIGRLGFLKNPHVLIAGQNLPAKIIKEGAVDQTDLTVLSVDEERIPVSLRLRRNPLCRDPAKIGDKVVIVSSEKTDDAQIISPQLIAPELRERFNTLVSVVGGSGSGVFDSERRCLMGIMSRKIMKLDYRREYGGVAAVPNGFAGYFVPASEIAHFIPSEFHF